MKYASDKLGILIAVAITIGAVAFVASTTEMNDRNMQAQGERVLERTADEILETPSTVKELVTDTIDEIKDVESDIPETVDEAIDKVEDAIPEKAVVVKQSKGKLLELIAIPSGTAIPGCEKTNTCFIPAVVEIKRGGEVIWENHDTLIHTVTSGTVKEGPNVLFDSGMLKSDETFSVKLDLPGEYDYFCLVHPWMSGKIIVK